jgi:hypothetical protein
VSSLRQHLCSLCEAPCHVRAFTCACALQVMVPTYWQRALRLPPEAAAQRAVFMHDFHSHWSHVLFYGNELRLFTYAALVYCCIDCSVYNAPVSAFCTYLIMAVISLARSHWGEANLSRKTLVDRCGA